VRRAAHSGKPFVFVSGNHDSDFLSRELAGQGAVVLTRNGRLNADGTRGPVIYRYNDLRIAGYDDPFSSARAPTTSAIATTRRPTRPSRSCSGPGCSRWSGRLTS
jgi:hypothetical protein